MENSSVVAHYLIHLSENATSKLKLNENPRLRNSLNNACINFRHYPANTATQYLVTLFYGDKFKCDDIIRKLFKSQTYSLSDDNCEKVIQDVPIFAECDYQVIAQELLYQYSIADPDILTVEAECPGYEKELNNLKKAMNQHPVLLFRAVQMCKVVSHVSPIVSRCTELLLSKSTVSQRIGLELMGFNFQHRILLFPYAKKIGQLLYAMHKTNDSLISPFVTWLNQHEGIDSSTYSLDESIADELPQYLLLNEFAKFICDDSEVIEKLPRSNDLKICLIRYKTNLDILLEKEEYLYLTKAIITFLYAKKFFSESQDSFSMGDLDTFAPLCKSIKIFENAKQSYAIALNNFIASCN